MSRVEEILKICTCFDNNYNGVLTHKRVCEEKRARGGEASRTSFKNVKRHKIISHDRNCNICTIRIVNSALAYIILLLIYRVTNADESFFRADGVLPDLQYAVQQYCTCKKKTEDNNPPELNCKSDDTLQRCGAYSTHTVYHRSCISSAHSIQKRAVKDESINDNNDEPPAFDMINYDEDDNITVEVCLF